MEKLALTVRDLQETLGIGRTPAYNLVNRADFPSIRIGRKILIPRDAFLRWLEAQTADKIDALPGR